MNRRDVQIGGARWPLSRHVRQRAHGSDEEL